MKKNYVILLFLNVLCLGFSEVQAQYTFEDRWPNLKFKLPVGMYTAPDSSKRIFVLEQAGRIKVFKDSGIVAANDTSTFLYLANKVPSGIIPGNEYGLLGMAFHPNFKTNGYVFVNYTRPSPLTTYVSRFKLDSVNKNKLNPASEKVILKVAQPYSNHNGGSVLFGDDGFLYISLGDGGSGGDPGNRAQNRSEILGKILRIDVDVPIDDSTYQIPPSNPFAGNTVGWRKEIFTYGMRNPWKISKDPAGSTIWIGDVGQGAIEEVDTLRIGANYGWKVMEGNASYSACGNCDTSNYEKPIWTYNRTFGSSITGGFVYRGSELTPLGGAYIYGDYNARNLWALKKDLTGIFKNTYLTSNSVNISSFGLDNQKELYVVSYSSTAGKLMKLRCALATPVLVTPTASKVCQGDSIILLAPNTGNPTGYRWSSGDTTRRIVLKNTGTYSLSVKTRSTLGCYSYSSNTLKVSIVSPPGNPIIPNVSLCNGDSTVVTMPSGLFYKWSDGSIGNQFTATQTGQYWSIASDSIGCKSDTGFFNANFETLPPTPTLSQTGPNSIKSDSLENGTYVWLLDGNNFTTTSSATLTITQSGVYRVVLVSPQGCRSDTSEPFNVTAPVSIKSPVTESVSISPNPFRDKIEVELNPGLAGNGKLQLFSIEGKELVLYRMDKAKTSFEISTTDLPKGVYVLKISTDKLKKTLRVVKE